MLKPRPSKPPTIILDNSSGDAQNLLSDPDIVNLHRKLIEAVNRLYAEGGFTGASLKLGWRRTWWKRVVLAEFRLRGAILTEITVELYGDKEVQVREGKDVAVKDVSFFSSDLYETLRKRAKILELRRK